MNEKLVLNDLILQTGFEVIPEYKFHPSRRFRFDWFIKLNSTVPGVAVEYEGGIFSKGRHVTGKGFNNDCIKYNLAQSLGIPVLRYTVLSLDNPEHVFNEIKMTCELYSGFRFI